MSVHVPQARPGAFVRSYTMVYAWAGNLTLLVAVGGGWLTDAPQALWSLSPVLLAAAALFVYFVARANILHFGERRAMSGRECALSALCTGGLSALAWALAYVVVNALGADFF